MTLDEAIELLEITTDLDSLTEKELYEKRKRAMRRWHPDPHTDEAVKARYEQHFKRIEPAVQLLLQYLNGTYIPGQPFEESQSAGRGISEEELRREAPQYKERIHSAWEQIRRQGWKMGSQETILSDGFSLRDKLREDLNDDIAALSILSFFSGFYAFAALAIPAAFFPILFYLATPLFLFHTLCCLVLLLPLSRLWLPGKLADVALFSGNTGLRIGDFILSNLGRWAIFRMLVMWPFYFAKGASLLIVRPLYELVGHLLKDKVVGVKKRMVRYFNDFYPEAYVDLLLGKDPAQMDYIELVHLSDIYQTCQQFK